jgi:hypothetical protein
MLKMSKLLAVAMIVAGSTSAAFARGLPPQDRTAYFVDSGRYFDGMAPGVPYYSGHRAHMQHSFERRNSALIGFYSTGGTWADRESLVHAN